PAQDRGRPHHRARDALRRGRGSLPRVRVGGVPRPTLRGRLDRGDRTDRERREHVAPLRVRSPEDRHGPHGHLRERGGVPRRSGRDAPSGGDHRRPEGTSAVRSLTERQLAFWRPWITPSSSSMSNGFETYASTPSYKAVARSLP